MHGPAGSRLPRLPGLIWAAALAAFAPYAVACHGGSPTTPAAQEAFLARLVVTLSQDTLQVGQAARASAAGFDQNGAAVSIGTPTWASGQADVATVTASGGVTAVRPGLAYVIASVSGIQSGAPLTVIPIPVARVSLTPASATLDIGRTLQLTLTPLDTNGNALTGRVIAWTSSDTSVATVSPNGLVAAVAAGVTTIRATCEGFLISAAITVTPIVVPVASVTVSPPTATIRVGHALQLTVTLMDAAGNPLPHRRTIWTSSTPGVATVSDSGLVAAIALGTATISVTADGKSASATITVVEGVVVSIGSPNSVQVVVDTLLVTCVVASSRPLSNVGASLAESPNVPYQTSLVFVEPPEMIGSKQVKFPIWYGIIVTKLLATGEYTLIVTATDDRGTQGVASVQFHHEYGHAEGSGTPSGKKRIAPPPPKHNP